MKKKIIIWMASIWTYIPIVFSIMAPMWTIIPLYFLSWILFSFVGDYYWVNAWYFVSPEKLTRFLIIILIEIIIFIIGLVLFIIGLKDLARGKKEEEKVIKKGIYKWIRHPQNLGIIIFTLPICLFVPFSNDIGIRIGDILSWSLFCLFIIVYSDMEENNMIKKYTKEYLEYCGKTGFFFPKLRILKKTKKLRKKCDYFKRYMFISFIYFIFIIGTYNLTNYLKGLDIIIGTR